MSNTDSFVDEVNEELRRDRLFATLRKWGPVALLAVLALVGYTAFTEWRAAQERAQAQAAGDAIYAALEGEDPQAALAALSDQGVITDLLRASTQAEAGDQEGARATLTALADSTDDLLYGDLAALKAQMLGEPDLAVLDQLAQPGRPFRLLAMEQRALALAGSGDHDAAIETARAVIEDAAVTPGLAERMQTLIIALGGDLGSE